MRAKRMMSVGEIDVDFEKIHRAIERRIQKPKRKRIDDDGDDGVPV